MKLNPAVTEKIAADVFWTYAFENGLRETMSSITKVPAPKWFLERALEEISTYLTREIISSVDSDITAETIKYVLEACYEEVLEVVLRHVREEKNIIGPIFVEDFKDCREPDFKFMHFLKELSKDSDENCDYEVVTQGDFTHIGTLLLRTPLPSGVLLKGDDSPFQNFIIVEDTKKALGFHKTLIFAPDGMIELPSNPQQYNYFLSGIFHRPTKQSIDLWYKLLPNTIGVREGSTFVLSNGNCLSFSIHSRKPSTAVQPMA